MTSLSNKMTKFLQADTDRSIEDLIDEFGESSFAIIFLLLMILPALPIPTGGITHIFEVIVALVAIELIAGRKYIWLPKRLLKKKLPEAIRSTALPKIIGLIGWVEKHIRTARRLKPSGLQLRLSGLVVLIFTAFAFLAPPFSGLDTLPSMGVVALSLSLIFRNLLLAIIGLVLGLTGIALVVFLSRLVVTIL